jgi:hypothetical protein
VEMRLLQSVMLCTISKLVGMRQRSLHEAQGQGTHNRDGRDRPHSTPAYMPVCLLVNVSLDHSVCVVVIYRTVPAAPREAAPQKLTCGLICHR